MTRSIDCISVFADPWVGLDRERLSQPTRPKFPASISFLSITPYPKVIAQMKFPSLSAMQSHWPRYVLREQEGVAAVTIVRRRRRCRSIADASFNRSRSWGTVRRRDQRDRGRQMLEFRPHWSKAIHVPGPMALRRAAFQRRGQLRGRAKSPDWDAYCLRQTASSLRSSPHLPLLVCPWSVSQPPSHACGPWSRPPSRHILLQAMRWTEPQSCPGSEWPVPPPRQR